MNRQQTHRGFTIVELMVTMSILGLMLFLINSLFNDTSRAVTTSVQTSKIIAAARSIDEQIGNDSGAMLGPSSSNGGYIVIIQQRLPNAKMLNPTNLAEVTVGELRTDQIVFIRDAQGLRSMTPSSAGSYGTSLIGRAGDFAKVTYSHALRTKPDGTITGSGAAYDLGGASAGLDRVGVNFILGRQALLFDPYDPAIGDKVSVGLSTTPSAYTYTSGQFRTSPVNNTGFATPKFTYMGLTDVSSRAYSVVVTDLAATGATDNSRYLNTAYLGTSGTRLRVNPSPNATNYESWAIAQGHPILAQNCSEMIVDFAADLNGNGRIDTQFGGGADTTGAIYWYDALKQPNLTDGTAAGTTGWTAQSGPPAVLQPWVNIDANTKAFVFRVDDDLAFGGTVGTPGTAHSYWPYLIRMRYRLHDTRGRLTSNYPLAMRDGINNDGDTGFDTSDAGNDEDKISGRWFERVIKVPRP